MVLLFQVNIIILLYTVVTLLQNLFDSRIDDIRVIETVQVLLILREIASVGITPVVKLVFHVLEVIFTFTQVRVILLLFDQSVDIF